MTTKKKALLAFLGMLVIGYIFDIGQTRAKVAITAEVSQNSISDIIASVQAAYLPSLVIGTLVIAGLEFWISSDVIWRRKEIRNPVRCQILS